MLIKYHVRLSDDERSMLERSVLLAYQMLQDGVLLQSPHNFLVSQLV